LDAARRRASAERQRLPGRGSSRIGTPPDDHFDDCDDIGYVELTFPPPLPSETVGYAFEVLAGHAPEGLLPEFALSAITHRDRTSSLSLTWIDGATLEQEPISFVLGIRTVDRAGNRSRTVTRVLVQDPGRQWTTGARPLGS
jgi:hypothetical protein